MAACHIVCFGNELHGDDGFGVRVYAELQRLSWPADVALFNAGIAGLNALHCLEDCSRAILVDALANVGKAGEVYRLGPEDLPDSSRRGAGHGLGIPYLLEALKVIRDPLPDIVIVGAEIAGINPFQAGLSASTERAVAETVRLIQGLVPA